MMARHSNTIEVCVPQQEFDTLRKTLQGNFYTDALTFDPTLLVHRSQLPNGVLPVNTGLDTSLTNWFIIYTSEWRTGRAVQPPQQKI